MAGNQRRDIGYQQCKVFMRPLAKLRRSGMSVEVGTGIKKAQLRAAHSLVEDAAKQAAGIRSE